MFATKNKKRFYFLLCLHILCAVGCGQFKFTKDTLEGSRSIKAGDLVVLSGGTAARNATPFPLHQAVIFSEEGSLKSLFKVAGPSEFLMGMALSFDLTSLLVSVDGVDRIERIRLNDSANIGNHIVDANLNGTTLRTVASLSDGGTIVAESTTVIEKYDANGLRVSTGFPITLTANIMKVRKISGNRFVALTTGGTPDSPRVYSNAGALISTPALGLSCTTNCDPSDILELSDGRFVISIQAGALNSLELYSSSFSYIGQLYRDTNVLQGISALAQHPSGDVIACSTAFNTCERIRITGNIGSRVGSSAFIGDVSLIRQPTDVLVIP